jgi:hypothetical protein
MYFVGMQTETPNEWSEIDVMKKVAEALASLEDEARQRVLKWTNDRFGFTQSVLARPPSRAQASQISSEERDASGGSTNGSTTGDLAEFFTSASPATQSEKALVVGYWFQALQGLADLDSQQINTELKNLGHGVSNITRAFDELISTRPQVVIQTRKSGTAKQARKKYRLTAEGIARVKQMIGRRSGDQTGVEVQQ